jgi:hypothetical protein
MKSFFFGKKKLFVSLIQASFFWWIAFAFPGWCVQNLDLNGFFKKNQKIGIDAGSLFYTETKEFDEAFEYFKSRPLQ